MKTLKRAVIGLLTMVAIVLLFSDCDKVWLFLATKAAVIPVAALIAWLWGKWKKDMDLEELMDDADDK